MNRKRWLGHSSLFVFVIAISCAAFAQDAPKTATANIPFEFYISGAKLPAGPYTLNIIAPTYVLLRSQDGTTQQDLYFLQTASPKRTILPKSSSPCAMESITSLRSGATWASRS